MILFLCIPLIIVVIFILIMIIKHETDSPIFYALLLAGLLFLWPIVFAYVTSSDLLFNLDWLSEL